MLLQALYECKYSAVICTHINKVVFFKTYNQKKDSFWAKQYYPQGSGYGNYHDDAKNTKYTREYLNNLFKQIHNE